MADQGLTHVALPVSNLDKSIAFYAKYAGMQVVHRRPREEHADCEVAWLSDLTRPFVVVLAEGPVEHPLGPFAHLGVACASRTELDRLVEMGRAEGCFRDGPHGEVGDAAGCLVNLVDPDGHTLELSYGQNVEQAVDRAKQE